MLCLPAVPARISDWGIAHTCTGTRIRTEVCVAEPVYVDISGCAAEHACDAGQIAADLLAIATGHPGAVRHLDREKVVDLAGET